MIRQESSMRGSVKLSGKASTSHGRAMQIMASRGVFLWLPVACSNDLVHGSWWYVWGSLVSAFIAMIPLIDLSVSIFNVPEATSLKAFDESATWVLLIISSIFFTIGSYVFVRAFESPPKPPLFTWRHFATDELLAAWLYLFAMSPYIPYAMFYINVNRHRYVYWGAFFASIFFVAASAFFVYTCYPSHHHLLENNKPIILPITVRLFGEKSWLCRHVLTDWLAATWFFLYATLLWFVGSWLLLFSAENDRQIFVWITSSIDAFLFLIGSLYYVAGSYPPDESYENFDHDTQSIHSLNESSFSKNPMFEEGDYDHEKDGYVPEGPRSPDRDSDADALAKANFRPWGSRTAHTGDSSSIAAPSRDIDHRSASDSDADALAKANFRPWGSKVMQSSHSSSSAAPAQDDNIDRLAGIIEGDADIFGGQSALNRSPGPAPHKRVQIRHPEGADGDVFNVLHEPYRKDRG